MPKNKYAIYFQQNIAKEILKSGDVKDFVHHAPDIATVWLETDPGPSGRLFRSFIRRHGHRGIKEFDFSTETWGMNPRLVVTVLQSMVSNPAAFAAVEQNEKPRQPDDEWLKSVAQNKSSKYHALKFFVPRCRDAVCAREKTKSLLIHTVHVFRMAYRRLADLLVRDGKMPDPNLIFFLTHSEIGELIRSNGAALINKANRRRKLHPQLDAIVFPEMSIGIPRPVDESASLNLVLFDFECNFICGSIVDCVRLMLIR